MARKAFEPTPEQRKQVEAFTAYGMKQEDMCLMLANPETGKPIDLKTLHKHFRYELDTGLAKAGVKIAESVFLQAVGSPAVYDEKGNLLRAEQPRVPSCGIFLSKVRLGWKETSVHQHEGKGGGPIQTVDAAVLAKMTDEELEEYEASLTKLDQLVSNARGRAGGEGATGG